MVPTRGSFPKEGRDDVNIWVLIEAIPPSRVSINDHVPMGMTVM